MFNHLINLLKTLIFTFSRMPQISYDPSQNKHLWSTRFDFHGHMFVIIDVFLGALLKIQFS